jgi:hypothetical protein
MLNTLYLLPGDVTLENDDSHSLNLPEKKEK